MKRVTPSASSIGEVCTFVGGPMHGKRQRVPSRVHRVAAAASPPLGIPPAEPSNSGPVVTVFYQRTQYVHASKAGVFFFVLEGLSPASIQAAFKTLPDKIHT